MLVSRNLDGQPVATVWKVAGSHAIVLSEPLLMAGSIEAASSGSKEAHRSDARAAASLATMCGHPPAAFLHLRPQIDTEGVAKSARPNESRVCPAAADVRETAMAKPAEVQLRPGTPEDDVWRAQPSPKSLQPGGLIGRALGYARATNLARQPPRVDCRRFCASAVIIAR